MVYKAVSIATSLARSGADGCFHSNRIASRRPPARGGGRAERVRSHSVGRGCGGRDRAGPASTKARNGGRASGSTGFLGPATPPGAAGPVAHLGDQVSDRDRLSAVQFHRV